MHSIIRLHHALVQLLKRIIRIIRVKIVFFFFSMLNNLWFCTLMMSHCESSASYCTKYLWFHVGSNVYVAPHCAFRLPTICKYRSAGIVFKQSLSFLCLHYLLWNENELVESKNAGLHLEKVFFVIGLITKLFSFRVKCF